MLAVASDEMVVDVIMSCSFMAPLSANWPVGFCPGIVLRGGSFVILRRGESDRDDAPECGGTWGAVSLLLVGSADPPGVTGGAPGGGTTSSGSASITLTTKVSSKSSARDLLGMGEPGRLSIWLDLVGGAIG